MLSIRTPTHFHFDQKFCLSPHSPVTANITKLVNNPEIFYNKTFGDNLSPLYMAMQKNKNPN